MMDRKERNRQYYLKNKERLREHHKKHYFENEGKRKQYAQSYYLKNKEKIREYNEKYNKEHKEERKVYAKEYSSNHKEECRANLEKSNASHEKEIHARCMVFRALQKGEISKQPCEICGNKKVHAHHDDYNKPLDIRWLCPEHHVEWHKNNEAIH